MNDKPGRIVLTAAGYRLIVIVLLIMVGFGLGLYSGLIRIG